jgi:hypothetical protein
MTGEDRLLVAVMRQALRDFDAERGADGSPADPADRESARRWFIEPDVDDAGSLSLEHVCSQLGLCVRTVRAAALAGPVRRADLLAGLTAWLDQTRDGGDDE